MPRQGSMFSRVYKDLDKLINIMIALNFKEIYVTGKLKACELVIQSYKNKKFVQKKELDVMKRAWENNFGNIKEQYERKLKGLL